MENRKGLMTPTILVLTRVALGLGIKASQLIDPMDDESAVIYLPAGAGLMTYNNFIDIDSMSGHSKGGLLWQRNLF
jgi:hypothetical protein